MPELEVVEICAGAGGQSLGLELAGFRHRLAVELDVNACATLRTNLKDPEVVRQGDVADPDVWMPEQHKQVALLAGGVPCPPFSIAGKQLGANDERDLFAWAVELCAIVRPRALMLENVRGLSMPRFSGYRQHVLDRLGELGYLGEWKLLHASEFGVPQLRPRFVLVALLEEDAAYFRWPEPATATPTVGEALYELMAEEGWPGARAWAEKANDIGPTIVGGSKKHGGADLGPTRAKKAWLQLGVDAMGVADAPPNTSTPADHIPKLTTKMVSRLQGWDDGHYRWHFVGRKTSVYRQIGNAFPPPVARAIGEAIIAALRHEGTPQIRARSEHDPIYKVLRDRGDYMTPQQILRAAKLKIDEAELERRISLLSRDFSIDKAETKSGYLKYRLGAFSAFVGQDDHLRHDAYQMSISTIS